MEDVLVEETKPPPSPPTGELDHFVCPVCNSKVDADASICPGCGAQFVEGEASEFECPVCKASVAADAASCPGCGVRFASDEAGVEELSSPPAEYAPSTAASPPIAAPVPGVRTELLDRLKAVRELRREARMDLPIGDRKLMYRELPKLVNDVKGRLLAAKRIGLHIDEQKRLINDAIAAGKRRDIEKAVRTIDEARYGLDLAFTDYIADRIDAFAREVQRVGGTEASSLERTLQDAVNYLETGDYDSAWETFQRATDGFQAQAKDYHKTRDILEQDERLLAEARGLGMGVKDLDRLIRSSREAMDRRDVATAMRSAKQVHEAILRDVPEYIQTEMKKARNTLLDMKMHGGDLSKPIGILKAASVHVKKEEWGDALRYLKEFRRELETR